MNDLDGSPLLLLNRNEAQILCFVLATCETETQEIEKLGEKVLDFLDKS